MRYDRAEFGVRAKAVAHDGLFRHAEFVLEFFKNREFADHRGQQSGVIGSDGANGKHRLDPEESDFERAIIDQRKGRCRLKENCCGLFTRRFL
jgi:hypothetical protein